jgi:hypothetical protein
MKIAGPLAALVAVCFSTSAALAQADAHSTPEDRRRFVTIVQNLERTPLDAGLHGDRSWAIQWVTDAPDVTVTVCAELLDGAATEKGYAHTPEIVVQYMLATAAFVIQNADKANDPDAAQLAGVEGALKAYQAMRAAEPQNTSPKLENLLGMQSRGELPGFVRKAYLRCAAKSAKGS